MAVRANDGSWVIHFGVFEADLRAGELRRNGSKVKLQEQPFQILAMLLERPGEIVTREELRARLWSADTFVDFDHGLNSAIRRLRDALGDSAENPSLVETLGRRGYRFISAVGFHDSQTLLGEPSSPKIQSLVVLPLENLSKDPEEEYFTDGMTDQLMTNLAQIGALRLSLEHRRCGTRERRSPCRRSLGSCTWMPWSKAL